MNTVGVTQDVGRSDIQKTRCVKHLAIGAMAVLSLSVVLASTASANVWYNQNAARFETEASNLNANLYSHFYDGSANMFRSIHQGPIADTVPSDTIHDNGYIFWSTALTFYAFVEGEKAVPGTYRFQIKQIYNSIMQQYFSQIHGGYAAWIDPDKFGSNDLYYDDNALAVIALSDAYTATLNHAYKDQASQIMKFTYMGRDNHDPGGLRWGFDTTKPNRTDRAASANTLAAIAALKLAAIGVNRNLNVAWGKSVLDWVSQNLIPATRERWPEQNDYLVRDACYFGKVSNNRDYSCPANPTWHVRNATWTYNSGNQILGRVFLYQLNPAKEQQSLTEAQNIAQAVMSRTNGSLYDGAVADVDKKYWFDSGFFIHHLADGLIALRSVLPAMAPQITAELLNEANYAYTEVRDPTDGMYWRNWRIWKVDPTRLQQWNRYTGQNMGWGCDDDDDDTGDPAERVQGKCAMPLAKGLLPNAGMARFYWLLYEMSTQ